MSLFSGFKTTEVEWQERARQIDDCDYLFVKSISEIEELTLALVVVEAKTQKRAYLTGRRWPARTDQGWRKANRARPDTSCF